MNVKQFLKILFIVTVTNSICSKNICKIGDLVHLNQAIKEFAQTQDYPALTRYKTCLAHYYTSGAYERDVQKACTSAWKILLQIPVTPQSLVIFDIDDTALFQAPQLPFTTFIWPRQNNSFAPALKPVLYLYKQLIARGFNVIFLTARGQHTHAKTLQELKRAGYTKFDQLILMPYQFAFNLAISPGNWKLNIRKQLAKQYTIVACIGDRPIDFEGGHTGYPVKLPNYLY